MPNLNLRVGQQVMVLDESHGWAGVEAGDIGTITSIDRRVTTGWTRDLLILAIPERHTTRWMVWSNSDFVELLTSEPYERENCGAECLVSCADCGRDMAAYDGRETNFDGDPVCGACGGNYCTCSDCEVVLINTATMRDAGGHRACVDHRGDIICHRCFERHYFACADCQGIFPNHDAFYDDSTDGSVCESCLDSIQADRHQNIIHDYAYKPSPVFHGEGPVYFGVELEVDIDRDSAVSVIDFSDDEDLFYLKEDGSVNGYEIVTHPASLEHHLTEMPWKKVLSDLKENGGKSHDTKSCGIHVHISRKAFTDSEISRLVAFVNINESWFSTFARRNSEQWAKYKPYNGNAKQDFDQSARYEAVNLKNRNTIELRIFRGTLKLETVFAILQLCDCLTKFIKTVSIASVVQKPAAILDKFKTFIRSSKHTELIDYCESKNLLN